VFVPMPIAVRREADQFLLSPPAASAAGPAAGPAAARAPAAAGAKNGAGSGPAAAAAAAAGARGLCTLLAGVLLPLL
jgi:hypothetical protein